MDISTKLIFLLFFFLFCNVYSQTQTTIDSTDLEPTPIICKPGISIGYMLIRQPNITSMMTVGNTYNVSWDWSIMVTKPPTYVDVYIQLMTPGVRTTWKQQIKMKQSVEPRWFLWKPDGMADGKYKLRLVPDGKETFNVASNLQPCFENGESIPSVSAAFTVSNPKGDLANYPDQFPPNSAAFSFKTKMKKKYLISWLFIFVVI